MLSAAAISLPTSAQDCSISARRGDWDDMRRFRECLEQYAPEQWGDPWLLHKASRFTGNPTMVRLLLQQGWDPNAPDDNGLSPLHQGARNSNPMVVSHLIDAGADLSARDNEGYTALHWAAAQSGNDRVVKVLLDRGADPLAESNDGRTPLHSALRYRAEPSVVSRMLDAGADAHLTPLQLAVLQGNATEVDRLLANGADPNEADRYHWGPLHFAVPLADQEVVSALLATGTNPHARTGSGATALHLAASQAPASVVEALLRAGADPDVRDEASGKTPLHYAAQYRERARLLPVIAALIRAGADPGSPDTNMDSPLHMALPNPEVTASVVEALLDAGSDPMARNRWGNTPLHVAAGWTNDVAIIEALLAAGADPRAENEDGERPAEWGVRGSEAYWRLVVPEGTLAPGRAIGGSLSSSDAVWDNGSHYDVWTVTAATVGQRVVIDMESDDVDAYLRVLRKDGTPVATNDDGGSGSNARVEFRAVYAGEYLVIATSFGEGETGGYRVGVR